MEKINELFEQEVIRVVDAFPSIYGKDDVVSLLTTLRTQVLIEVSELNPIESITEEQFQEFSADVVRKLDRALSDGTIDVYDGSSPEFSIDYDNRIQLENVDINTDNITDEVHEILLEQFQVHFKKLLTDKPE